MSCGRESQVTRWISGEEYLVQEGRRLRRGYTTGSCAAAAALAAARLLLGLEPLVAVAIKTPGGPELLLDLEAQTLTPEGARCVVRKDAGDDPDVTDGALIGCTVSLLPSGFQVEGGKGVGRVTLPGLSCPVGASAINPVPQRMIREQLERVALEKGYTGGLLARVDVPEGEALAQKTFNPRLGIEGGISILGTTGIVEPRSQRALVATIRAEMDQLAARGYQTILVTPGNYGKDFAQNHWGLSLDRGVLCSNFIGEAVDYAAFLGFRRLLLMGHGGKLVKLAAGIMNTHSRMADGRKEIITTHGALAGASVSQLRQLMDTITVDGADELLTAWGLEDKVWASVGEAAAEQLARRGGSAMETALVAFGSRGILFRSGMVEQWIKEDFS